MRTQIANIIILNDGDIRPTEKPYPKGHDYTLADIKPDLFRQIQMADITILQTNGKIFVIKDRLAIMPLVPEPSR